MLVVPQRKMKQAWMMKLVVLIALKMVNKGKK